MKIRTVFRDKAPSRRALFLRPQIIMLLLLAPLASGQLIYSEVKIKVSPGTTCPATWTASEETITIEALYIVTAPASIGGRAFRVSATFVDLIWPSVTDKSEAVASGTLVIEAGSVVTQQFCALLP